MKKIAVINDLSGFGKCSLSVAMPIISACGIQCCPLTTGVFSNQTGYDSYKSVDFTEYLPEFIAQWKRLNPKFDAILTGFIPNSKQGNIIIDFIKEFKSTSTLVVVDPVMGDDGSIYHCYDSESLKAVSKLTDIADVITPNLTELCILCNEDYSSLAKAKEQELMDKIYNMSSSFDKTVITTGIKLDGFVANTVYSDGNFNIVKSRLLGGGFSGTGDILSSFVTAKLVNGDNAVNAVGDASKFIEKAIEKTLSDNEEGYIPADGIHFEAFIKEI